MLTALIKCLHLVIVLSLLSGIVYCIALVATKKKVVDVANHQLKIHLLHRYILGLAALALVTGTLLVHPRHFTFHTVWIQTAYVLVSLFIVTVGLLLWFTRKHQRSSHRAWLGVYAFLAIVLVVTIHDAVTKTALVNLAFVAPQQTSPLLSEYQGPQHTPLETAYPS